MLQQVAEETQPFGDNRADMRFATCIARLIRAIQPELSESQTEAISNEMRTYLKFNQPDLNRTRTPEEAEEVKRRLAEGRS